MAEYIRGLSASPLFKDVNLVISDEYLVNQVKVRKFVVEMGLNNNADITGLGSHPPVLNSTAQLPAN